MMAGREDGSAVFDSYANHLAAVVGGEAKFIADGGCPHVARRLVSGLSIRTDRLHGIILRAVSYLAILHEVVAGDAVDGRNGTCIDRGVTDGGDRRNVRDATVLATESFVQESLETTLAVASLIAIEIIPTHLVNNQSHDQLWTLRLGLCNAAEAAEHEDKLKNLLHSLFIVLMMFQFLDSSDY